MSTRSTFPLSLEKLNANVIIFQDVSHYFFPEFLMIAQRLSSLLQLMI